ncbi:unnamed protein product [Oppiella nova]|uniref:glutathione transferase n=1 Tax=Oppiella nova TaxID=334625 RepID=A0A7R9MB09_9ACAR|nr:unnamed protein product [Oppiella nova]CAG2173804.1 unnamed protein product [Oppiella nova]
MSAPVLPILGYRDIRGLGQPIRYLLTYAGVEFVDRRYGSTEDWLLDKHALGLQFPNLPYYIDSDKKLTQSTAIMRYLGRKYGLYAVDGDEPAHRRQDMAEQHIYDMKSHFHYEILMREDWERRRDAYCTGILDNQLNLLAEFLGDNEWLIGDQLSYIDFTAYEVLDWFRVFAPISVDKHPIIGRYLCRFENLGPIAAYRKSSKYKSWPMTGPRAKWGSK